MGIFNAMVEALVIFKILFDLMLEIGMLLYRGAVALIQLIIAAIKHMIDKQGTAQAPVQETINDDNNMEETV